MRRYQLLLFVIYLMLCSALVVLSVAAHAYPFFAWDLRFELALQAVDIPAFAFVMGVLTWIGGHWIFAIIVALTASGLVLWGNRREAAAVIANAIGAEFLAFIIKQLVHRSRPSLASIYIMHSRHTFGFPSGHVVRFVALYGFLFALAFLKLRHGVVRTLILILLGGLLIGIGLSRVYLGEHWPSDVIGGYLTGLCGLGPTLMIYSRLRIPPNSVLNGYPPSP
jgi:undecaprenyl-diphosphatase